MKNIISINALSKSYKSGFNALKNVSLDIIKGEIFALLGPNGAGKTTLISIITGITTPTSGTVIVNNYDVIKNAMKTRSIIGLVPQEVSIEPFETVLSSVKFSRGLFGKAQNPQYIEKILILERNNDNGNHDGIIGSFNLSKDLRKYNFEKVFIFNSSLRFRLPFYILNEILMKN